MKTIREHIIETASDLFYRKGFNSTGINEIISEAGVAKATLYNYFKSKDHICVEFLRFKNTNFIVELGHYVDAKPKGKGQVLAIFDFLENFYNSDNFFGCWCINTSSQIQEDDEMIQNEIHHQKELFFALIERIIRQNLIDPSDDDVERLSRKVYLLYEGAITEAFVQKDVWPIHSAREICNSIL